MMRRARLIAVAMLALELTGWGATTIYVATNGLDSRTGFLGWTNAVQTISKGIDQASTTERDVVLVSNGTYLLPTYLNVNKPLTLMATSTNPADTVVNGNNMTNCLMLNHSNAVVSGFTFTNGTTTESQRGGGVTLSLGLMTNCVITGCHRDSGGGVMIYNGSSGDKIMRNCVIEGNTATDTATSYTGGGGVLFFGFSASPIPGILRDCVIRNNVAGYAGVRHQVVCRQCGLDHELPHYRQ